MSEEYAERLFRHAERFCESGLVVSREIGKTNRMSAFSIPSSVLGAFSLELYLKALLTIECKDFDYTHDLKKLYNKLTQDTQSNIEKRFAAPHKYEVQVREAFLKEGIDISTIQKILEECKNAFKLMRYPPTPEEGDVFHPFTIGFLLECVRDEVLSKRPDWPNTFRFGPDIGDQLIVDKSPK